MIIYLDESKKIGEGKIVFGGFISKHKHQYIQKIVKNKKALYGFSESLELKGTKDTGKLFYDRMIQDTDFSFIKDSIIGIYISGYDKDSLENYTRCIIQIIGRIKAKITPYSGKITIYADRINLGKISVVEKHIARELNSFFGGRVKILFFFKDSKGNYGIQISDLLSYQMRLCNINNESINNFLFENTVNMDLREEFKL